MKSEKVCQLHGRGRRQDQEAAAHWDFDENRFSIERSSVCLKRRVIDELRTSFVEINKMQMKHSGSVQITETPGDGYQKYVQSVEMHEKGGMRQKMHNLIGNLMKSKYNNDETNSAKLLKVEGNSPGSSGRRDEELKKRVDESKKRQQQGEIKTRHEGENETNFERPTTREFERQRRQALKEQKVRTKTLNQWNLADYTQGQSDLLEPRQRIESLRTLSNDSGKGNSSAQEFVSKPSRSAQTTVRPNSTLPFAAKIDPDYKQFSSLDYSRLAQHFISANRLDLTMEEYANREATKNGDALWFDPLKIKEAVSHESIANISQTRNRWQQMVDENQTTVSSNPYGRSVTPNAQLTQKAIYTAAPAPRTYSYSTQSLNDYGRLPADPIVSPSISMVDQRGAPMDSYERERLLFLAYIHTHPDVVASLGMTVPYHVKQKFASVAQMKVEIKEVVQSPNGQINGYGNHNGNGYANGNGETLPNGSAKNGRYIKNAVPQPIVSVTQRKIVRKQSSIEANGGAAPVAPVPVQSLQYTNGLGQNSNGSAHFNGSNGLAAYCNGNNASSNSNGLQYTNGSGSGYFGLTPNPTKKSWKLAEWIEPPPAVNKDEMRSPSRNEEERSNSYRSPGESLIAKEIRELREREEDLRRSRSELGLANLDDVVEHWRNGQTFTQQPNSMRSAQSLDHLHVVVDNGYQQSNGGGTVEYQKLQTRSGSLDHLHYIAANGDPNGKQSQSNGFAKPSQKSAYQKFLTSHAEDKVRSPRKAEFNTIEAKIEQELEEIRQREEELKRQREANALIKIPNGSPPSTLSTGDDYQKNIREFNEIQNKINYKPVYELHKMDDPDEMMFAPTVSNDENRQNLDGWMTVGDSRVKL